METEHEISYLSPLKEFADAGRLKWENGNELWIQQYPFDSWTHPFFSDTTIDVDVAKKLKDSFDKGVKGTKLFADYEHGLDKAKGNKAAGEIKELKVIETPDDAFVEPGLWGRVAFNDVAKAEIDNGEWNYWSTTHWDEWLHPQTGEKHEMVYDGGALTNKPYVKGMAPLNFSEVGLTEAAIKEHAVLSAKQRKSLPDGAYMYIAPDGTRMFPFKHSDGSLDKVHLQKIVQLAPRANVPASVKARVISRAKKLLGAKSYVEELSIAGEPLDKEVIDEDTKTWFGDELTLENEGGDTDVELEKQLRTALKLGDDADIIKFVTEMHAEVEPMREALKTHSEKKAFSEQFPEEFKRMQALEEKEQQREAKSFAESYIARRLTKKDGEKDEQTTMGLSGLAIQELEKVAKSFSEGTPTLEGVQSVVDTILNNGIVDYGTKGSTKEIEPDEDEAPKGNVYEVRKAFADKVTEIMDKDSITDRLVAVRMAAEKYPKMAEAYHSAHAQ